MKEYYYCFDCETQSVKDPYPVQIAIVVKELGSSLYQDMFTQLIKPIMPLCPAAVAVHGITNDVANLFPKGKESYEQFRTFLAKKVNPQTKYALGHNIKFDIDTLDNFVAMQTDEVSGFMPEKQIDTIRLARKLIPEEEIGGYSLDACWYYLFRDIDSLKENRATHDALIDVKLTCEVFEELVKRIPDKRTSLEVDTLENIYRFCLQPMLLEKFPFGKHRGEAFEEVPISYINWFMKASFRDEWPDVVHTIQQKLGIDPI